MRTGVSYLASHNPKHINVDLQEMKDLGCDDVLLAAQENDFFYFPGKLKFLPQIANQQGIRPIAIIWGALNYFGGGKSSQFLLYNPQVHQVNRDGSYNPAGCYNNPQAVNYIKNLVNQIADYGYKGYFIDEPSLLNCYCDSCCDLFNKMFELNLKEAEKDKQQDFRKKCVVLYVQKIADHIKLKYPQMETMCCVMPQDKTLWREIAEIKSLDNLGTDIYWVNNKQDVLQAKPLIEEIADYCKLNQKKHHQWLQAWGVDSGQEPRIKAQADIIIQGNPDSLYVWAYNAQLGTSESCQDPELSWQAVCEILKQIKGL